MPPHVALQAMIDIVNRDKSGACRWFPPTAFNTATWARVLDVTPETIERWANSCAKPVIRRPGGGRTGFIALEDFWPAVTSGELDGKKIC